MTSRLSSLFGMLAVVLIVLSGCTGAAPTLDPTATNPPDPTSTSTEAPSPTAEPPTPTPTETPIPPPTLDLDIDVPLIDGIDNLPDNALARFGISGSFVQFVLFPDHSGIVLWSTSGVYAYRLPGFEPMWRQYLNLAPTEVTVSEDGSLVTAYVGISELCGIDVFVFDAETGQLVEKETSESNVLVAISVGSIRMVERESEEIEGEFIPVIEIYDEDEYIGRLELPLTFSSPDMPISYKISPGGQYIAVDMFSEDTLYIYQIPSLDLLYSIGYPENSRWEWSGRNTLFSYDGKYISYLDEDGRLNVFLTETGEQVYQSEMTAIERYFWSPNALMLSDKASFSIIAIDGWSEVFFQEHVTNVRFDLSPDEKLIAVGYSLGVMVFDTESLELEYAVPYELRAIDSGAQWSEDGQWLIIAKSSATLVNRESGEVVFAPFEARVLLIDGGKAYLLTEGRLLIVDLNQGKVVDGVRFSISPERLQWAIDEDALVIDGESATAIWSEESNELRLIDTPPEVHPGIKPYGIAYSNTQREPCPSPDGEIYALAVNSGGCGDGPCGCGCGYYSSALQLYQGESEQPFAEYSFGPGISTMSWSPDGSLLALGHVGFTGFDDDTLWADRISIIDPTTGQVLQTLEGHSGGITGLLFSPDGSRLVSTSEDGTIIIWAVGDD